MNKKISSRGYSFAAKKAFCAVIMAVMLLSALVLPASAQDEAKPYAGVTLNVYNWGEYIPDGTDGSLDINKEFTRRTGIEVAYVTYDDNETMYSKLNSGAVSYDIIVPSDYMIERLIAENMLQKLNFENIPNYSYIDGQYKNLYYDKSNEYSVPYTSGMVGIIYNTTMVEGTPDSWNIMWDEQYKGKILQFNNSRDAFMTAQILLASEKGVDLDAYVNTEDKAILDEVAQKLKEQRPLVQKYVMDEVYNKMESGEAAIAAYYAGDYYTMLESNEDLAFFYPKEGTNFFVDALCIPTCAKNKEAAELYINFLLEPDIALEISEFIYYRSPHTAVLENEEYSLYQDEITYPSDIEEINTVLFKHLDSETLEYMGKLWDEVRQSGNDYTFVYIGLAAVVLIAVISVIISVKNKKKRAAYED